MIATLYVLSDGPYCGLPGVDPWPESRDARLYAGPWPVVAHPPCARWGAYWFGSPCSTKRYALGDDGGCFSAALAAVRRWGGVLEHPAHSKAWRHFGLSHPQREGWVAADTCGGWTCAVEQGHYGHLARKPTWLYAVSVTPLPSLHWGRSVSGLLMAQPSKARMAASSRVGDVAFLSHRQRALTPLPFRDLLLDMARSVPEDKP